MKNALLRKQERIFHAVGDSIGVRRRSAGMLAHADLRIAFCRQARFFHRIRSLRESNHYTENCAPAEARALFLSVIKIRKGRDAFAESTMNKLVPYFTRSDGCGRGVQL